MKRRVENKSVITTTIANTNTVSSTIETLDKTPTAVLLPITTGTTFTFKVSADYGATFTELRDKNNAVVTITKTAGEASMHTLDANELAGFTDIQIVSGSTELAERTIKIVCLEI